MKKKRRPWLAIIIVILVIGAIASAGKKDNDNSGKKDIVSGGDSSETGSSTDSDAAKDTGDSEAAPKKVTIDEQLLFEKECVVADILKDVAKSFDLDSIDVFYKDADKPLFSEGKYPSGMTMRDFVSNQKYMTRFDENGVHVMNNIGSLRHTNEKLFDLMEEKKCMSLLQVAQPNCDDPEYFFSCNMLNRIHKWSDAEVSNLGLLGALIYGVLSKKT